MQQTQLSPNKTNLHSPSKPQIDAYSSIGKMIKSHLPSAPEYSIGKSLRSKQKNMFLSENINKLQMAGTSYTAGPSTYFPSQKLIERNGKKVLVQQNNKQLEVKYARPPSTVTGNQVRQSKINYFKHFDNVDQLEVNQADKLRKQKSLSTIIGSQKRFSNPNYKSSGTPSPFQYKTDSGINFNKPPKYSFARRALSDPKLQRNQQTPKKKRRLNSKLNVPGPGSYFTQKPLAKNLAKTRSQSVNFLRTPQNSTMRSVPLHKIPLSHRSKIQLDRHGYMQQTYDIKTKTIMAHYDFENDGGKGFHSGLGWLKDRIDTHSKVATDKFKMRSYSIGKSQRGEVSRGTFQAHMQFKPTPIRIQHPKF